MPQRTTKAAVNSIDVARLAGVSQSAVSRVFTPGASVSAAMREKVLAAAAALGYQPNRLAGSLITHRSGLIGIAFCYLGNFYYPLAIESLSRRLRLCGYHTMIFFAEPEEPADATIEAFLQYRVDGVIVASASLSSDWVTACERAGVPVVFFSRCPDDPRVSAAVVDNLRAAACVADFLVRGGHRRLAYLGGVEDTSTQRDREAGFRQGLAAHGMPLFDRALGQFACEPARAAARSLLDRPAAERPDAVFACSDQMAIAVMDVVRFELGLKVPEDVSVVGFDGVPQANWPAYDLTTYQQHVDDMIEALTDLLLERLASPEAPPRRAVVQGSLVVRRSARVPHDWPSGGHPRAPAGRTR